MRELMAAFLVILSILLTLYLGSSQTLDSKLEIKIEWLKINLLYERGHADGQ